MNRLLLFLLFFFSLFSSYSQHGYLFVKKGPKKKKTYAEGERILLQVNNDTIYSGLITLLRNDTIFINGRPIRRTSVTSVILSGKQKKKFRTSASELLLITGGAALTTAGLTLSKQASLQEAMTAGVVIGYSPLLLRYMGSKISLKRKRYRIRKKFYLQVLDFHLPRQRGF